jgi:hypothetical protein
MPSQDDEIEITDKDEGSKAEARSRWLYRPTTMVGGSVLAGGLLVAGVAAHLSLASPSDPGRYDHASSPVRPASAVVVRSPVNAKPAQAATDEQAKGQPDSPVSTKQAASPRKASPAPPVLTESISSTAAPPAPPVQAEAVRAIESEPLPVTHSEPKQSSHSEPKSAKDPVPNPPEHSEPEAAACTPASNPEPKRAHTHTKKRPGKHTYRYHHKHQHQRKRHDPRRSKRSRDPK